MDFNSHNSDMELMERCYRRLMCGMTCYACKFVPEHIASDIVQDVFLKLWQSNRAFYRMVNISEQQQYLYKCIGNACRDWIKHNKIVNNHSEPIASSIKSDEIFWYERFMENEDFRCKVRQVNEAISILPERCREIFTRHYMEQKKSADIAIELGISVRTVEAQSYKALSILRKNLKSNNK